MSEKFIYKKTGEEITTNKRMQEIINEAYFDGIAEENKRLKTVIYKFLDKVLVYMKLSKEDKAEDYIHLKKNEYVVFSRGRKKGTYKLSKNEIQNILNLVKQGKSKREIADIYGVNEKTIRNYIKINS